MNDCEHETGWVATWNGERWVWRCKRCKVEK